jgi:competence protein ComEC
MTAIVRLLQTVVLLAIVGVRAFSGQQVPPERFRPSGQDVLIYFFDVGQADAALVRTPDKKNILIDGGSAPYSTDRGETVVSGEVLPFLQRRGIEEIDTVILSHAHPDHAAGLTKVLRSLPVRQVIVAGQDSGIEYEAFLATVKEKKIPLRTAKAGEKLSWDHGVKGEVLGPPAGFSFDDANDHSIILRFSYGDVAVLFPGDAGAEEEDWAAAKFAALLAADIIKVPHHGSWNSLNGPFLAAASPSIAIFSCGKGNPFGHPHKKTIAWYRRKGITCYRTDRDGTLRAVTDGKYYAVQAEGKTIE